MKLALLTGISLWLVCSTQASGQQDCKLAHSYLDLAHQRIGAADNEQAADALRQAIEACPSYDAYEALGELEAQSPYRADRARAVDAFVSAHQLAPSDQARARTLFSYARLLTKDGDPQNAYSLVRQAQTLDPKSADIAQLSDQIEQQVRNPTKERIVRGLWNSLYKPLHVVAGASGGLSAAVSHDTVAPAATSSGPSAYIPINFETDKTVVDEQTRQNVAVLANALADPAHTGQHFLFIGHADIRGPEAYNLVLSKRRAQAIYEQVVALEPNLGGRIEVTGRGSSDPIDPGHDERAYRANRRLQVVLE
jgi:outer membrane protein OmpA-like peptidoglycan-associated protein